MHHLLIVPRIARSKDSNIGIYLSRTSWFSGALIVPYYHINIFGFTFGFLVDRIRHPMVLRSDKWVHINPKKLKIGDIYNDRGELYSVVGEPFKEGHHWHVPAKNGSVDYLDTVKSFQLMVESESKSEESTLEDYGVVKNEKS